jgi:hypothetical protein
MLAFASLPGQPTMSSSPWAGIGPGVSSGKIYLPEPIEPLPNKAIGEIELNIPDGRCASGRGAGWTW